MTLLEQTRFFAILDKASALLALADSLRQECRLPDQVSAATRGAMFKARLQIGVVISNVSTALYTMRKGSGNQPPVINHERDALVFDEFVSGYCGSEALSCRFVYDAFMSAAEVLMDGAEKAAKSAEMLVRANQKTHEQLARAIFRPDEVPVHSAANLTGSDFHA
jgi:hypothetical protein